MAKFEITQRSNGEFQFNLKANNGKVILSSEGYKSMDNTKNGIESVKKNSLKESNFVKLIAKNGQLYFNLKASNSQIIGTSEMYTSEKGRDTGIDSVIRLAEKAEVVDLTKSKKSN